MSRKNEVNKWIGDLTKLYGEVRSGKAELTTAKAANAVSRQVLSYMRFEHQINQSARKPKRKAAQHLGRVGKQIGYIFI